MRESIPLITLPAYIYIYIYISPLGHMDSLTDFIGFEKTGWKTRNLGNRDNFMSFAVMKFKVIFLNVRTS